MQRMSTFWSELALDFVSQLRVMRPSMLGLVSELVVKVDEGMLDTRQPLLQGVAWASRRGQRHGAPLTG